MEQKTNKPVTLKDGRSWWLRLKPEELAPLVLLAIELDMPKSRILPLLEDVHEYCNWGEYGAYTGTFEGIPVTVVYHGSGAFSVSQAIEELAQLGAATILRVGSCGGISPLVKVGDVVTCEATIRDDRVMLDYVPAEYPAVASFDLLCAELDACREEGLRAACGVTLSTATFYPGSGHPTAGGIFDTAPYERVKLWEKLDALCVDIESSVVLLMARLFHMKGGSMLCVSNHAVTGDGSFLTEEHVTSVARAALKALVHCK